MSDRPPRPPVRLIAAMFVVLGATALAPSAAVVAADRTVATTATTVPSVPDTTVPDTTDPDTTEPDSMASGDDDSDLTAVTIVAVMAFVLLLAFAGWWMVSRADDDDAEYPRPLDPDEPLPGQDLL